CQITTFLFSACTDVRLSHDCELANTQVAAFGGSAQVAPAGMVCDGASGLCAAQRTGPGTCCHLANQSFATCAAGNDPGGITCAEVGTLAGMLATSYVGYRCVGTEVPGGTSYNCVP